MNKGISIWMDSDNIYHHVFVEQGLHNSNKCNNPFSTALAENLFSWVGFVKDIWPWGLSQFKTLLKKVFHLM